MNNIKAIFDNQTVGISSAPAIIFTLVMAFVIGMFIFWVYKKNYRGVMFSTNFGLTLVLLTTVTAPVVMCIRNSVQLSMGMVGALSIVRFRTAVKDPLDTAFMFWALTMGILLGAGQFFMAALAAAGIAGVVFALRMFIKKGVNSYLLVIRANQTGEANAVKLLGKVPYYALKSKTMTAGYIEETYEIRTDKNEAFINKLSTLEGIKEASLVAYQSETT